MNKQSLLETGYFKDNEWLDKYCALINTNKIINNEPYQSHHIIMRSFYKKYDIPINNTKDNLIKLTYSNHLLAHYYLCYCCQDDLIELCKSAYYLMARIPLDSFDEGYFIQKESILYDNWYKEWIAFRQTSSTLSPKKSLRCVDTGEIFDSVSAAADWAQCSQSTISRCLNESGRSSGGGYHWQWANEEPLNLNDEKFHNNKCIKVKNLETGKIFDSLKEAEEWSHSSYRGISKCCKGLQQSTISTVTRKKYHWEFY